MKTFALMLLITVLSLLGIGLIENARTPYHGCPRSLVGLNEPYPNVYAPYGIDKYTCRQGTYYVVREK